MHAAIHTETWRQVSVTWLMICHLNNMTFIIESVNMSSKRQAYKLYSKHYEIIGYMFCYIFSLIKNVFFNLQSTKYDAYILYNKTTKHCSSLKNHIYSHTSCITFADVYRSDSLCCPGRQAPSSLFMRGVQPEDSRVCIFFTSSLHFSLSQSSPLLQQHAIPNIHHLPPASLFLSLTQGKYITMVT